MIATVLFDLDGVVRHFEPDAALERRYGLEDGAIAQIAFASPLIDAVTTGRLTRAEWIARIGAQTTPDAASEWGRTPFRIDDDVIELVAILRSGGIRCAILTNGTDAVAEELRSCGVDAHFDRVFNSADIGYAKPDPRAFTHVLDSLGQTAGQVFFTDDSAEKLVGARALGLSTHLFRGVVDLRLALRDAGVET